MQSASLFILLTRITFSKNVVLVHSGFLVNQFPLYLNITCKNDLVVCVLAYYVQYLCLYIHVCVCSVYCLYVCCFDCVSIHVLHKEMRMYVTRNDVIYKIE